MMTVGFEGTDRPVGDSAAEPKPGFQVARAFTAPDSDLPTDPELLELIGRHEWDELVFGGFICLTCTPEEAYDEDPDKTVAWPCPPLRAAGMTNEHARAVILAHRAAIEAEARAKREQVTEGVDR